MSDPNRQAKLFEAALRASLTQDLVRFVETCTEGLGSLIAPDAVHAYLRGAREADLELRASWTGRSRDAARRPPALLDRMLVEGTLSERSYEDPHRLIRRGGVPWPGQNPSVVRLVRIGAAEPPLGVFLISPGEGQASLSAEDEDVLVGFMKAIGPALHNIAMVDDLRETSLRDDIAACYNRRYFDAFVGEEIARARRFRSHVSVLFLDMDNLKEVNSAHGHAMGSRTLFEVSHRINDGIRKIDKLFRFGGDEFCIVLPETDARGALEVATRIRSRIAASPLLVQEAGGVHLTASLGAASFPEHGSTAEALVQAADRAMQGVKASGKNAAALAQSAIEPPSAEGTRVRPSERRVEE